MLSLSVIATAFGVASQTDSWRAPQPNVGGDPSDGWLTYAQYKAPADSVLTNVSMSWNVPTGLPTSGGSGAPGWWYGVQTAAGNGALVQPIVACDYGGAECKQGTYVLWGGVFDWTKPWAGMHNSKFVDSKAGDEVYSYTTCNKEECTMYVRNERTLKTATLTYKLPTSKGTESVLYIVLEHAPESCEAYPPKGATIFKNIYVEVDGKQVTPTWEAVKGGSYKCESKTTIVDSKTVAITWNGGSPPDCTEKRYHCDTSSQKCVEQCSGHSTMALCEDSCNNTTLPAVAGRAPVPGDGLKELNAFRKSQGVDALTLCGDAFTTKAQEIVEYDAKNGAGAYIKAHGGNQKGWAGVCADNFVGEAEECESNGYNGGDNGLTWADAIASMKNSCASALGGAKHKCVSFGSCKDCSKSKSGKSRNYYAVNLC